MVGSLMSCLVGKQGQRQEGQKAIRRVAMVKIKVCLCSENARTCEGH